MIIHERDTQTTDKHYQHHKQHHSYHTGLRIFRLFQKKGGNGNNVNHIGEMKIEDIMCMTALTACEENREIKSAAPEKVRNNIILKFWAPLGAKGVTMCVRLCMCGAFVVRSFSSNLSRALNLHQSGFSGIRSLSG